MVEKKETTLDEIIHMVDSNGNVLHNRNVTKIRKKITFLFSFISINCRTTETRNSS